jgi:hypothetical protein
LALVLPGPPDVATKNATTKRAVRSTTLEQVRKEVRLGPRFAAAGFRHAFDQFISTYNVLPQRALCAPDVLMRFCELFDDSSEAALLRTGHQLFFGVPLVAAVMAPGTIAFEGEVEEEKMEDP